MKRTRASAARDYVERLRKHFKAPTEWREAVRRYSTYLTATLWEQRKSPGAATSKTDPEKARSGKPAP